ncbi:hypothetical protein C922_05235 [Plasmodium inui San Antonio 1]|uniref:DUF676 domain-containing protein n=1 Tax=Plasmodium inui San Antonio 1 TaxID=1237626 RepID=W6ZYK8_9APIC|nr:hypothetical protein C922_05235 [Plasmodium inui San Antonio 1]EUD64385.1 hypothetical protein C922_05235 [Plasmodium inui San Antonio 1]
MVEGDSYSTAENIMITQFDETPTNFDKTSKQSHESCTQFDDTSTQSSDSFTQFDDTLNGIDGTSMLHSFYKKDDIIILIHGLNSHIRFEFLRNNVHIVNYDRVLLKDENNYYA